MYAFLLDGNVRLTRNEALREYARLEYRGDATSWLLASTPRGRPAAPKLPRLRLFARPTKAAARAVACKGTPRRTPEEVQAPG